MWSYYTNVTNPSYIMGRTPQIEQYLCAGNHER